MVACFDCGRMWQAGELPMELERFAKLLKALQCAQCGADSKRIGWEQQPRRSAKRAFDPHG